MDNDNSAAARKMVEYLIDEANRDGNELFAYMLSLALAALDEFQHSTEGGNHFGQIT